METIKAFITWDYSLVTTMFGLALIGWAYVTWSWKRNMHRTKRELAKRQARLESKNS